MSYTYKVKNVSLNLFLVVCKIMKNKAEFNANLKASKQQIKSSLEPTSSIKNNLIEKQAVLINMLYDETTATAPAKSLLTEIQQERSRLEKRIW